MTRSSRDTRSSTLAVTIAVAVAAALAGCGSRGAPLLRSAGDDGQGTLLPGCRNVSARTPPLTYQTKFYLSTLSSAWVEGAQSGFESGLKAQPEDRSRVRFTKELTASVVARSFGFDGSFPHQSFCMHYSAPEARIRTAIKSVLPHLQNTFRLDEEGIGVYYTEFFERQHLGAKWKDRFIIHVRELSASEVGIYVYRDLWISRQNTPFVRAESNGGNEAWFLQNVGRALR